MSLEKILKTAAIIIAPAIVLTTAIYLGFDDIIKQQELPNYETGRIISAITFGSFIGSLISYNLLKKFYQKNYK